MGSSQSGKQIKSRDQAKLHSYYTPNLDEKKAKRIEGLSKGLKMKYVWRSFVIGFIFQYCLGASKIYDTLNKKTTTRRLSTTCYIQMQRESRIYRKDWPFNKRREEWPIIKSIINQPSDDIDICYFTF